MPGMLYRLMLSFALCVVMTLHIGVDAWHHLSSHHHPVLHCDDLSGSHIHHEQYGTESCDTCNKVLSWSHFTEIGKVVIPASPGRNQGIAYAPEKDHPRFLNLIYLRGPPVVNI